jgi:adenylate cyclase
VRRDLRGRLQRGLGDRYPMTALVAVLLMAHLVVAAGVGLLELYVDLGRDRLVRVLVVVQVLMALDNLASWWLLRRLLAPARPFLAGDRSEPAATAAWRALAGLPLSYVRHLRGLPVLLNVVPVSAYIAVELGGDFLPAFLAIGAGSVIVMAYGVFLRFFGFEQVLRPLVEAASCHVPDGTELGPVTLSLRARLLFALPTINVVTGVVVAGLVSDGEGVEGLGAGVLLALAVSFTIALELSLLLLKSVLGPLGDLRRSVERVAEGELAARVPVASSDEVGRLGASFNAMAHGLSERRRLHDAFGAYVDPLLAERVLADGVTLDAEEVEVTVLFVDVQGFTAFAERAAAREVVAELNRLFEVVVPVLARHGGHANKFIGDGLLGVFGAPDPLPDHADRAIAAACDVVREVARAFDGRLRIGIGVSSGTVVAGTVGGGGRVEFTVIGDAVNTAARVEEVTRATGDAVLLTDDTRRLLRRDHGPIEPRRAVALRGKAAPVPLFAALAAGGSEAALAAPLTA